MTSVFKAPESDPYLHFLKRLLPFDDGFRLHHVGALSSPRNHHKARRVGKILTLIKKTFRDQMSVLNLFLRRNVAIRDTVNAQTPLRVTTGHASASRCRFHNQKIDVRMSGVGSTAVGPQPPPILLIQINRLKPFVLVETIVPAVLPSDGNARRLSYAGNVKHRRSKSLWSLTTVKGH